MYFLFEFIALQKVKDNMFYKRLVLSKYVVYT